MQHKTCNLPNQSVLIIISRLEHGVIAFTHVGKRGKCHRYHLSSSEHRGVLRHRHRHKQINHPLGWYSIPFHRVACGPQLPAIFREHISDVAEHVYVENDRYEREDKHKKLYGRPVIHVLKFGKELTVDHELLTISFKNRLKSVERYLTYDYDIGADKTYVTRSVHEFHETYLDK